MEGNIRGLNGHLQSCYSVRTFKRFRLFVARKLRGVKVTLLVS